MSAESAEPAEAVENLSSTPESILPERIRQHLGSLLAAAYGQGETEPSVASRFADLLAKLDVALGEARGRDEAEFQKQLLAVAPALQRFAISLAREQATAEDLVQETLLRAWRNRASYQHGTNLEAWTFTILRNLFYSHRRKHREVQDDDGGYAARLITLPEQAGRLDLQDVQAALNRLAPMMRDALVLVTISNMTYEEVAVVLGCQVGTVKSRVWRARDQLTRILGYSGAEIGTDAVMLSANGGSVGDR